MSKVNISAIRELRTRTSAGFVDCKKALLEVSGDIEEAIKLLRTKGLAEANKKVTRHAVQGVVGIKTTANKGVIIELNAETDFVARNEQFLNLTEKLLDIALLYDTQEQVLNAQFLPQITVADELKRNIAIIGENISLSRFDTVYLNASGIISSYVHNTISPNIGKIAVLVVLHAEIINDKLHELGKQLAMHIAAAKPIFLTRQNVPSETIRSEEEIFSKQHANKPAHIIDRIVDGHIQKFYQQNVLLEQIFAMDEKTPIAALLKQYEKELQSEIHITDYKLFVLGNK